MMVTMMATVAMYKRKTNILSIASHIPPQWILSPSKPLSPSFTLSPSFYIVLYFLIIFDYVTSIIPPQWVLSPSKPLSLPLTLSFFSLFSPPNPPQKVEKGKSRIKMLTRPTFLRSRQGRELTTCAVSSESLSCQRFQKIFSIIENILWNSTFQTYFRFFSRLNPLPRMHMSCYGLTP